MFCLLPTDKPDCDLRILDLLRLCTKTQNTQKPKFLHKTRDYFVSLSTQNPKPKQTDGKQSEFVKREEVPEIYITKIYF